ncbi:MAG: galactoside ABC transporter permease, partial [Atopobiaceae bacterium]|nr:galactoside ABC transporter permease [Atopobiaceae bacterium]
MAAPSGKILSIDDEAKLIQPIDEYVSTIQSKVDELRAEGTTKVVTLQTSIDVTKSDRVLTKAERDEAIAEYRAEMEKAKKVEAANKPEVDKLIADAEAYL